MRPVMRHPRLWLVVCAWCLIGWTAPAQASWEAYQQAGETAYSRGRYTEAERMFLAAVREARRFGPQDPRLDISLNKLARLRVIRGQQAQAQFRSQRTARKKSSRTSGTALSPRSPAPTTAHGPPACQAGTSQTGPARRASWSAQKGRTEQHRATGTPVQTTTRCTAAGAAYPSCCLLNASSEAADKRTAGIIPADATPPTRPSRALAAAGATA